MSKEKLQLLLEEIKEEVSNIKIEIQQVKYYSVYDIFNNKLEKSLTKEFDKIESKINMAQLQIND